MESENTTKINKKIFFFFPSKSVGGVTILFMRLAKCLETLGFSNIYLIDFKDGYMMSTFSESSSIKFIEYKANKMINFSNEDIVIFQSMPFWAMPSNLIFKKKTKIIYWNLHPYNMFVQPIGINKSRNLAIKTFKILFYRYLIFWYERKYIQIMNAKKSLYFMDGENILKTEKMLSIKFIMPSFMPLLIDEFINLKINHVVNHELNCMWLGRIVDFKYSILVYTLKELNLYSELNNQIINFYVIGDGELLSSLKNEVSFFSINIIYIKYLNQNDIKTFIQGIDLGFAMGTSALDISKYGLPTILLDYSYNSKIYNYNFKWLFSTMNFNLGTEIEFNESNDGNTISEVIDQIKKDYNYISKRTFDFTEQNFSSVKNAKLFSELINKANLKYEDLPKKIFKMNIFHKLIGAKKYYVEQ